MIVQMLTWACVALFGLLGLISVVHPETHRGIIRWVHAGAWIRLVGFVLVGLGMLLFAYGSETNTPLFIGVFAVLFFLVGGAQMVIPTVVIVLGDWLMERSNMLLRVYGVLLVGAAYLFFRAVPTLAPLVEEITDVVSNGL